jgi:uncharacterized RDD family membrane protein YckC
MNCTQCGLAASPASPYCLQCGAPVPQPAAPIPAPHVPAAYYPYHAPAPAAYIPQPAIPHANFGLRFVALLIDEFFAFGAAGLAGGLVVGAGVIFALLGLATKTEGGAAGGIVSGLASYFIAVPIAFLAYLLYFVKLESGPQQATIGKLILGIKLVDAQTGQRISGGQSLGRFFVKHLFSGWFFSIGFLMALFTDKKQALHDLAAGTLVVRK